MTRLVLDTNVWVSGIVHSGTPRTIVTLAFEQEIVAVTSPALLDELNRVLGRDQFGLGVLGAEALIEQIRQFADLVVPSTRVTRIEQDPADNRVLECAVDGGVDAIISGDRHLLELRSYADIPIRAPGDWLREWKPVKR